MKLTCTYLGNPITIVSLFVDGSQINMAYIDATGALKIEKKQIWDAFGSQNANAYSLAVSATSVS